jgi:hypothetical protein
MSDLLWNTAISISRSVAATTSVALIRHAGTPQVQAFRDAQQNLDLESNGEALESLAAIDPSLAQALTARRRLAAQLNGDMIQ